MLDVGRDRLGVAGTDLDFERRLARHGKTQPPLVNHDPPPRACGETVCTAQPARHSLLVPLGAEANETETVWELAPVARRAAEQSAEPGRPSVVVGHPISELERGTVTDMLAVAARKLGDPVACVVLVVAGDRSFHGRQPTSGSSNIADAHISRAPRGRPGGAVRFGEAPRNRWCSRLDHWPVYTLDAGPFYSRRCRAVTCGDGSRLPRPTTTMLRLVGERCVVCRAERRPDRCWGRGSVRRGA